jgi:hypothetical protein
MLDRGVKSLWIKPYCRFRQRKFAEDEVESLPMPSAAPRQSLAHAVRLKAQLFLRRLLVFSSAQMTAG